MDKETTQMVDGARELEEALYQEEKTAMGPDDPGFAVAVGILRAAQGLVRAVRKTLEAMDAKGQ